MKKLNIKELGLDDDYIIENEGIEYAISKTYFALRKAIDLVNSQQEAIEKLKEDIRPYTEEELSKMSFWPNREKGEIAMGEKILEPADDKPEYKLPGTEEIIEKLDKATLRPNLVDGIADDTHRTVTLRIPKGMRVGKALFEAWDNDSDDIWSDLDEWLQDISDTDLQKALDEVQPNE